MPTPANPCTKGGDWWGVERSKGRQTYSCHGTENGGLPIASNKKTLLLTVFQESYEMRLWNTFLVTVPVQALLATHSATSLVSQRSRQTICCLAACHCPFEISDLLFLLVTLVHWLHRASPSYISTTCD